MVIRTIAFGMMILVIVASALSAQQYYFYGIDGQRIPLTLNDSLIAVKVTGGTALLDSLLVLEPALGDNTHPFALPDGFWKLRVKAGYAVDSLVRRLRATASALRS